MNKYQDENGLWIGPRDEKGFPCYGKPFYVLITDDAGEVIDTTKVFSELDLPDQEDLHDAILNS